MPDDRTTSKTPAKPYQQSLIDMIIYSSDTLADPQRVGAILASWRYREHVVFHLRDEAQSLAKDEKNPEASCHKRDVPAPPELAYLRAYFGNRYGLNCNITATHFPTLLEENMWGYFGSVGQNRRANIPGAAAISTISKQVGSFFLPKLVPALIPYLPPGYIGVEKMVTWQIGGVDKHLTDFGAGYTASVARGTGELVTIEKAPEAAASAAAPSKAAGKKAKQQAAFAQAVRKSARNRDGVDLTLGVKGDQAKAKAEKEAKEAEKATATLNEVETLIGKKLTKASKAQQAGGKKRSRQVGDTDDDDDADWDPKADVPDDKLSEEDLSKRKKAQEDLKLIKGHFFEWFDQGEKDIGELYVPAQPNQNFRMVPMYVGALNNNIKDTGMISFIRLFSREVHTLYKAKHSGSARGGKAAQKKFGCAFIIFSTALKSKQDLEDSNLVMAGDPDLYEDDGGIPYKPDVANVPSATDYRPCEVRAWEKGKQNKSALVCIYDPIDEHGDMQRTPSGDQPPLRCVFTNSAENAIKFVDEEYDGNIHRFAVLGYGMLEAGLTLQTYINWQWTGPPDGNGNPTKADGPERMFCPQYMALATSEKAPLDGQLQIAGRSFVDLKERPAPPLWNIKLLGVKGRVETLNSYSKMEERFSVIGLDEKKLLPMYEALKRGFNQQIVGLTSFKTLGFIGTRRGEFARMLGLTPDALRVLESGGTVEDALGATDALADGDGDGDGGVAGPSGSPPGPTPDAMQIDI